MSDLKRVLILGGTGDAAELAAIASQLDKVEVISSLAGRTQQPIAPIGSVRVGGFGGEAGLLAYLQEYQVNYLIDATHPFAAQISWNAAAAATRANIPHLMLVRPAWQKKSADLSETSAKEDRWLEVDRIEAAVTLLEKQTGRIFLTIGRQQLAPFARLQHLWFLMRSIDPPDPTLPLPQGKMLYDRGPFTLEQERKLIIDYNINLIVSKNSGGNATYAKVIAAREMGIPMIMINRPAMPSVTQVSTVNEALNWLKNILQRDIQL
ncbi:cobalt-precorrin-6A reductase [Phormidesmis sp. 146-35]